MSYRNFFGEIPPLKLFYLLEEGDPPELDNSELLELDYITKFQSFRGAAHWDIDIGRINFQTAIMTLSRFLVAPRTGHMDRIKSVFRFIIIIIIISI